MHSNKLILTILAFITIILVQCRDNFISLPDYMSKYRRPVKHVNRLFSNGKYPIDLQNVDLIQYLTTLQSIRNIKIFQNPYILNRTHQPKLNCREKEIYGNGSVIIDCCLPVQVNPQLCNPHCKFNASTSSWIPFSVHCYRKLITKPFSKFAGFVPKKNISINFPKTTMSPPKMVMYVSEPDPHFQKQEETTTVANDFLKPQQVTLMIIFKRSNSSSVNNTRKIQSSKKITINNCQLKKCRINRNKTLSTMSASMPAWVSRIMNQSQTENKTRDIWARSNKLKRRHRIIPRRKSSIRQWMTRKKKATKHVKNQSVDYNFPEELTILYLSQTKRKSKTANGQNYTETIIESPTKKRSEIEIQLKQNEIDFNVTSFKSNLTTRLSRDLFVTGTTKPNMQLNGTTTDSITTKKTTKTLPEATVSLNETTQETTKSQLPEDNILLDSSIRSLFFTKSLPSNNLTLIPPTWKNSRYLSFAKNTSLYCNDFLTKLFNDSQERLTELSNNLVEYGSTIILYIPTIFDQFINTVFGNYHIIKHCSLLSPITLLKTEILAPAKDCVKNRTDSGVFFISRIIEDTRKVLNKMNLVCNFEGCQDRPVRCRKLIWLFNEAFVEGATKVSNMFYDALLKTKNTHHDVLMCVTGAIKKLVSNFEMINSEFIKCAEDFFEEYEVY